MGFHLKATDREEMVLGPHRDKPACSPVGLHGACGRAFLDRKPLIVRDVKELGDSYIACDPAEQSELVIPMFHDRSAEPHGVLPDLPARVGLLGRQTDLLQSEKPF